MKSLTLEQQIFSGTDVVFEYSTDERSAEFEKFEDIEDPYEKQFAINQYFEKISTLKPQKLQQPKSKVPSKKIVLAATTDFDHPGAKRHQKALMEKFQVLTGAECESAGCRKERLRNVAFVIKMDKEEVHKIIFKALMHDDKLSHAYVYNQMSVIYAAQAQKEKEERPEKPPKEGRSPRKRR